MGGLCSKKRKNREPPLTKEDLSSIIGDLMGPGAEGFDDDDPPTIMDDPEEDLQ